MKLKHIMFMAGFCFISNAFAQDMTAMEAEAKPSDKFTPFNWQTTAPDGYIIQGEICNDTSGIGQSTCGPVTFVVDPQNRRILFDLGNNGGKYYILENSAYIYGPNPQQPTQCYQVSNFSFTQQVAGYLNVLSMPGSTNKKADYFGRALDVGSCNDRIAADMRVTRIRNNGVLSVFNFAQSYPIGQSCAFVTGAITFKQATVDFNPAHRDAYFREMPASCNNTAPSFCATVYPPGNACNL